MIQLLATDHSPMIQSWGVAAERFPNYLLRVPDRHDHDVVEMFFVLSGRGLHFIEGEEEEVASGDMGVVRLGQHHCIVTPGEPMDILNIYLDPVRFRRPGLSPVLLRLLDHLRTGGDGSFPKTTWESPGRPVIHDLIKSIGREVSERRPFFEEAIELYVRLLLLEIARESFSGDQPGVEGGGSPMFHPSVARALVFLEENSTKPLQLDEVARHTRTNKFHLCRLFRRETGTTVINHLQRLRIRQAMQRLMEEDTKVITIAQEVGFSDLANFNRVFRRLAGTTPTAYRRQAREELKNSAIIKPHGSRSN
ncbi:MAG: helix-turn-helix domain-containing protein [Candidatus Sumerlaeia bacterium]|nr:helix-turn-helix domain-containing protein [Candidatus Sumerlaeia bacterium]